MLKDELLKEVPAKRKYTAVANQLLRQGTQPVEAAQKAKVRLKPKMAALNKTIIAKRGTP